MARDEILKTDGAAVPDLVRVNDYFQVPSVVLGPDEALRVMLLVINRFSSELPARRTRESDHLRYAVNRRVAGSNPASGAILAFGELQQFSIPCSRVLDRAT